MITKRYPLIPKENKEWLMVCDQCSVQPFVKATDDEIVAPDDFIIFTFRRSFRSNFEYQLKMQGWTMRWVPDPDDPENYEVPWLICPKCREEMKDDYK